MTTNELLEAGGTVMVDTGNGETNMPCSTIGARRAEIELAKEQLAVKLADVPKELSPIQPG